MPFDVLHSTEQWLQRFAMLCAALLRATFVFGRGVQACTCTADGTCRTAQSSTCSETLLCNCISSVWHSGELACTEKHSRIRIAAALEAALQRSINGALGDRRMQCSAEEWTRVSTSAAKWESSRRQSQSTT